MIRPNWPGIALWLMFVVFTIAAAARGDVQALIGLAVGALVGLAVRLEAHRRRGPRER